MNIGAKRQKGPAGQRARENKKNKKKMLSVARYQHAIYSLPSTPKESEIQKCHTPYTQGIRKEPMKDSDRSTKIKKHRIFKIGYNSQ